MPKYALTEKTKTVQGHTLHQIIALEEINPFVSKGSVGGFIENEYNLSQEGECWVYNDACVWGDAKVYSNASVRKNAKVYGDALVKDYAVIEEQAEVYGYAMVIQRGYVGDKARVFHHATVSQSASICENAIIKGEAHIKGFAHVKGSAIVEGYAAVKGEALIQGDALLKDHAYVYGKTHINSAAIIRYEEDVVTVSGIGSRNDTTTFFKGKRKQILVTCGCFSGTIKEFKAAVDKEHGNNIYGREYRLAIDIALLHFKN